MNPKNSFGKEYESMLNSKGYELSKEFYSSAEYNKIRDSINEQYDAIHKIEAEYLLRIMALEGEITRLRHESYLKCCQYRKNIAEIKQTAISEAKDSFVRERLSKYKEFIKKEFYNERHA